ncbi:cupin domain-containing protein [Candidatus Palauibacter sp.]|uniref:cupin domain-containing protein n=1 Tax=Candidatus Palauibacter sp. TaxID=3101350 RepID=UPI003AF29985
MSVVNLEKKFRLLQEYWQPRVVAELNDYQFKIARVKGEFVWHDHADTDEAFFVLEGTLRIDLPDGAVELGPGEFYVVPRGVRHRGVAYGFCVAPASVNPHRDLSPPCGCAAIHPSRTGQRVSRHLCVGNQLPVRVPA